MFYKQNMKLIRDKNVNNNRIQFYFQSNETIIENSTECKQELAKYYLATSISL